MKIILKKFKKIYWFVVVGILVLLIFIGGGYGYKQYVALKTELNDLKSEKKLIDRVGTLVALPDGETPTIAVVTDKEKLSNQPLFLRAQNGDRVLLYEKSGRAVIYRPSVDKIIDIISFTKESTPSATVNQTLRFVLYNGTTTVGITKKMETDLLKKVKDAVVVDKDAAQVKTYKTSLLIDLTGKMEEKAKEIASLFGLMLSPMPKGEASPSADMLIIVGEDKK